MHEVLDVGPSCWGMNTGVPGSREFMSTSDKLALTLYMYMYMSRATLC